VSSFSAAPETAAPPTINTAAAGAAAAESPVVDGPGTGPYQLMHLITVRLTQDNYLYWRAQILPLLRSRHLDGFVDGSHPFPPHLVSAVTDTGARVSAENPAYRAWVAQDQAILSALQSLLTEGVAGLVVFVATSLDVWATMADSFSAHSSARASALRQLLQDCKKLDSSPHVYFNKIKTLADTLSAIGQPLRDSEFTDFVLQGLDQDYDNLVEAVRGRETPTSQRDLYSRLLSTEQRIDARHVTMQLNDPHAHAAYRGGAPGGYRPPRPSAGTPTGGAPGRQPPLSPPPRGPPVTTDRRGRPNVDCQLCGIYGHYASRCHRRFKKDFLGIGNDGRGNKKQAAIAEQSSAGYLGGGHQGGYQGAGGYTPSYPIDVP
jgi:hypothetical protein